MVRKKTEDECEMEEERGLKCCAGPKLFISGR